MNKSFTRAVAVTATCAAGLAGALAYHPTATAGAAASAKSSAKSPDGNLTRFGMKADVFGTKVVVNGVELRNAKDAYARQICTRQTGRSVYQPSIASLPDDIEHIELQASESRTKTYRTKTRTGVRGISTLGDIKVGGGELGGQKIPRLVFKGLVSKADSFHDKTLAGGKGAFGHAESFTFGRIGLDYEGTVVEGTPLEDLLDIINEQALVPVNQTVRDLVALLQTVGAPIEIPGLGSIALGNARGTATAHEATSEAYALKIVVNPTGEKGKATVLQLGRAYSRIGDGATSGIFNSQMIGLDLRIADTLHFGNIQQVSMPCEGTNGQVRSKSVPEAGVGAGPVQLLNLKGVKYRYMGKQLSGGRQRGFVESRLGELTIPSADITVSGLVSRVALSRRPGERTRSKVSGTFDTITIGDRVIKGTDSQFGQTWFVNGEDDADGIIRFIGGTAKTYHGARSRLLEFALPGETVIAVGIADGYANRK